MPPLYQEIRHNAIGLHKKVDDEGKQCGILIVRTITGHQKKQNNNQQIPGVKILGKQPSQKIGGTVVPGFRTGTARLVWLGRRRRRWWRYRLWIGFARLWSARIGDATAAVRTVGLWNVAVIHGFHLPIKGCSPPEPNSPEAARASCAARMAFSSLPIRSRVR